MQEIESSEVAKLSAVVRGTSFRRVSSLCSDVVLGGGWLLFTAKWHVVRTNMGYDISS